MALALPLALEAEGVEEAVDFVELGCECGGFERWLVVRCLGGGLVVRCLRVSVSVWLGGVRVEGGRVVVHVEGCRGRGGNEVELESRLSEDGFW